MNGKDIVSTAIRNTLRAKARTTLTVLAIFVGAFTLTLTTGIGAGISSFINSTVSSIGSNDVLTVTAASDDDAPAVDAEPLEYDPEAVATFPGSSTTALTPSDIRKIGNTTGVEDVEPVETISADYVQHEGGKQYVASVGNLIPGQELQYSAGEEVDNDSSDFQVAVPENYLDVLKFDDAEDAIGSTITLVLTDQSFGQHVFEAETVGVAEATLGSGGASFVPNDALSTAMVEAQQIGLPADQVDRWAQATAWFDPDLTDDEVTALKDRLADEGYTAVTTEDQLGAFTTVIDGIVLVLNGFAVIALLAAGFGIVNTLLMSVQERTREIGLMKAMGMSSRRVFALFSVEAVFIGFLGSVIGVVAAMAIGGAVSAVLAESVLSDLPGLSLVAFDPLSIMGTILLIMLVAFLAGTLPARRAARKDPVTALRYE